MKTLIPAMLLLFLAGCQSADGVVRVPVRGVITVNGAPLEKGTIVFIPKGTSHGPKAAGVIGNGTYEIDAPEGPVPGTMRVEIRTDQLAGLPYDEPQAFVKVGKPVKPRDPIPPKYNEQSELSATTRIDGDNVFDFQLVTK